MDSCQICNQKKAIYTCPRCSSHTCSMICSQTHKQANSCSGERDSTVHVPMNKYDWSTMTNDYMYLEEVGRKTAEWGRQIVQNRLMNQVTNNKGRRPTRYSALGKKKEALRLQLQARQIDMEILPVGMEKCKLNKSFFDSRTKTIFMTVELLIHVTKSAHYPVRILSHKHKLLSTLEVIVRKSLKEYTGKAPDGTRSFAEFAELNDLDFFIGHTSDTILMNTKIYYKLDPDMTLQKALESKTFVEYPTFEVWRGGEFSGLLNDETGRMVDVKAHIPKVKQTKPQVASTAITSLLQDYVSEDEEDERGSCLEMLGGYNTDNLPSDNDNNIGKGKDNEMKNEWEDGNDVEGDEMEDVDEPSEQNLGTILDSMFKDTLAQMDGSLSDNEYDEEKEEKEEDSGDEESSSIEGDDDV